MLALLALAMALALSGCGSLNPSPEFYVAQMNAYRAYAEAARTPIATVDIGGGQRVVRAGLSCNP
jgi:uncharacterized lipoprotein YmbA